MSIAALFMLTFFAAEIRQADIDAYAARSQAERPKALAAAKKSIIAVRRDPNRSREDKRSTLQAIESKIKALSNKRLPYYPPLHYDFRGESPRGVRIGWLDERSFVCFQVVDDSNSVVEYEWIHNYVAPWQDRRDPYERGHRIARRTYWLTGIPTNEFVNGERIELRGVFAINGTKTYDTVQGATNTVPVLEFVEMVPHETKFDGLAD